MTTEQQEYYWSEVMEHLEELDQQVPNMMSSYNDNDTTYNHDDYPIQFTLELHLKLQWCDIQRDEEEYLTPILKYQGRRITNKDNGKCDVNDTYSFVIKTDGTDDGTNAYFSHNFETKENKVKTTCHTQQELEVQYKVVMSPNELYKSVKNFLEEEGVITDNRGRGLKVWVEFTERGWKLKFSTTHTSTQEEIEEQRREEEEYYRDYE
tara:strand:+ start:852 stop:1475 length:624 start_codon:yes stop_codon:yes gene_type:complete